MEKIIYNNPEACVSNNGHSSSFFTITRGIRQGCPISALLFILVVEIMAIHIRGNNNIRGISTEDGSITITQLADDTTLFLEDIESLKEVLDFMSTFHQSSGLKLNKGKSEAMWIGSKADCMLKPLGLRWPSTPIKCLGIYCHSDLERATGDNFVERVKKLKNVLNMWSQRKISLKGKVAVIRSLALPQILYVASVLYTPKWVIEEAYL